MNNRTMVPMHTLIKSISMGPFGSDVKVEYMREEGMPIIDGSNLTDIKMNWDSYRYLDSVRAEKLQGAIAHKGDIIVTHRGTLGQLSYVPDDCPFEEFLISQSQFRVSLDTNLVNPVFFAYYFHTTEGQKRLLSFANYVGVPALASATTNFKELEFPLINLDQQSAIADILVAIDTKAENNTSICSDLESMAKLLYDYWFIQFDFPNENGKPYKTSGGKMVWNEVLKRKIPEGWETGKLESRISLERGISYSTANLQGEGITMINLGSFAIGGGYKDGNLKNYNGDYPDNKRIKPYDMIMCLTQQTSIDPSKDVIGCAMLVPDIFNDDIVISQDLTKISCEENLKLYLAQYFNTEYFHRYITGYASGSNILHLDANGVLKHTTYFPSNTLLKKFGEMIKPMWKKHSQIMAENQQLASLRDFLLPMLMNGQVKME